MSYKEIKIPFSPYASAHFSLDDGFSYRSSTASEVFGLKSWAWLRQIHGNQGHLQTHAKLQRAEEGDWHYTTDKQLGLGIFVADCTAILLAGRSFVAAIHAGWRGTAAQIIESALEVIQPTGEYYAWLSPSICRDHYEVSQDVIDQFPQEKISRHIEPTKQGHYLLDLKSYQSELLKSLGAKLWASPLCTQCQPEFFSYRESRGALKSRHIAWISLD